VFASRVDGRQSTLPVNPARVGPAVFTGVHGYLLTTCEHGPCRRAVNTGSVYRAPVSMSGVGKKHCRMCTDLQCDRLKHCCGIREAGKPGIVMFARAAQFAQNVYDYVTVLMEKLLFNRVFLKSFWARERVTVLRLSFRFFFAVRCCDCW